MTNVIVGRGGQLAGALSLVSILGCASAPAPRAPSTTTVEAVPVDDKATEHEEPEADDANDEAPPATWKDALTRYASTCPAPFFRLPAEEKIEAAGRTFLLGGSTLRLDGPRATAPVKIGVLGAVKDAEPDTRENVKKAVAAFRKAGAQLVLVNGDLVGNETGSLAPVVRMLAEEIDLPVFAHSGNYEWTSAFTESMAAGAEKSPHLFNMNIIRDVDLGGIHLVSLPGYFNRRFLQPGACHYSSDDVESLLQHVRELRSRGEIVILTSHGPPLGEGPHALDVTNDGANVGDQDLNRLLVDGGIAFGIFSHILESGGRATSDVAGREPVKLPMKAGKKQLYVNVGAATSYAWGMVDGKTSRGMAAIITVDPSSSPGGEARVELISLR